MLFLAMMNPPSVETVSRTKVLGVSATTPVLPTAAKMQNRESHLMYTKECQEISEKLASIRNKPNYVIFARVLCGICVLKNTVKAIKDMIMIWVVLNMYTNELCIISCHSLAKQALKSS